MIALQDNAALSEESLDFFDQGFYELFEFPSAFFA